MYTRCTRARIHDNESFWINKGAHVHWKCNDKITGWIKNDEMEFTNE